MESILLQPLPKKIIFADKPNEFNILCANFHEMKKYTHLEHRIYRKLQLTYKMNDSSKHTMCFLGNIEIDSNEEHTRTELQLLCSCYVT